jgi:hypothetical protein
MPRSMSSLSQWIAGYRTLYPRLDVGGGGARCTVGELQFLNRQTLTCQLGVFQESEKL